MQFMRLFEERVMWNRTMKTGLWKKFQVWKGQS